MLRLNHKQGATFVYAGLVSDDSDVPVNVTGYTLTSTCRDTYGTSVGTATITVADQGTDPGEFTLEIPAATTAAWAPGTSVFFDLRIVSPGARVDYTENVEIRVIERQTTS
jgi:hypothetical protein